MIIALCYGARELSLLSIFLPWLMQFSGNSQWPADRLILSWILLSSWSLWYLLTYGAYVLCKNTCMFLLNTNVFTLYLLHACFLWTSPDLALQMQGINTNTHLSSLSHPVLCIPHSKCPGQTLCIYTSCATCVVYKMWSTFIHSSQNLACRRKKNADMLGNLARWQSHPPFLI